MMTKQTGDDRNADLPDGTDKVIDGASRTDGDIATIGGHYFGDDKRDTAFGPRRLPTACATGASSFPARLAKKPAGS